MKVLHVLGALALFSSLAAAGVPADYSKLDSVRRGSLLRAGASGPAITALQHALDAVKAPAAATGVFDAATVAAVKSFQSSANIKVDGIVGPQTMGALDKALGFTGAIATPTSSAKLRRLKNSEVTPEITKNAVAILKAHRTDPFGTKVPFVADGKNYVGVIEQHYHPPGGPLRPWGPHPGVSVFAVE